MRRRWKAAAVVWTPGQLRPSRRVCALISFEHSPSRCELTGVAAAAVSRQTPMSSAVAFRKPTQQRAGRRHGCAVEPEPPADAAPSTSASSLPQDVLVLVLNHLQVPGPHNSLSVWVRSSCRAAPCPPVVPAGASEGACAPPPPTPLLLCPPRACPPRAPHLPRHVPQVVDLAAAGAVSREWRTLAAEADGAWRNSFVAEFGAEKAADYKPLRTWRDKFM